MLANTNLTFHSVALVTEQIEDSRDHLQRLLGLSVPESEEYETIHHVETEGVEHRFTLLQVGDEDHYVELFEPVEGPHRDLLDRHGDMSVAGFCLATDDIEGLYDRLHSIDIVPVDEAGTKLVESKYVEYPTGSLGFFLPREATGEMLIEIIQPYYDLD